MGKSVLITQPSVTNQQINSIVPNESVIDIQFLYYNLSSRRKEIFLLGSGGSRTPIVNKSTFEQFSLPLPPLPEQRAIAAVLGSLDDKIDLLQRQNRTLESLAQTLFRQWFVEEAEEFVDFDELVEINSKLKLKKGVTAIYLEMKNVRSDSCTPINWYPREYKSGTRFQNGDTLMARITPCLENNKVAYVNFLENDEVAWGSTEFLVLRAKRNLPSFYTYLLAKDTDFRAFAINTMTGSSGRQRVQTQSLYNYELGYPSEENLQIFCQQIAPIEQKLKLNATQIRTLEALRDTLLPKLMSGAVRVAEAVEAVEGVNAQGLFNRAGYLASLFEDSAQPQTVHIASTVDDGKAGKMPNAWLAIPETLYQLSEQPFSADVGQTTFQKLCYVLTIEGVQTGFDFVRHNYGPYSAAAVQALSRLERAGLIEQATVGNKRKMTKVRVQPDYRLQRVDAQEQLAPFQPMIERTVELFKFVKDTEHAEEIATILFAAREIERKHEKHNIARDALHSYMIEWKSRWNTVHKRRRLDDAINGLVKLGFVSIEDE